VPALVNSFAEKKRRGEKKKGLTLIFSPGVQRMEKKKGEGRNEGGWK